MAKETDQESEETQSQETEEQAFVEVDGKKYVEDTENPGQAKKDDDGEFILFEEKTEETEPKITLEDTHRLAQALQKGYTITRQDQAKIRGNIEEIKGALTKLGKKKEEDEFGEDEPLTTKKLLEVLDEREKTAKETRRQSDIKIQEQITSQLDDLKAQGAIPTKKEEDELLEFAVKRKITNLSTAYERLQEIKSARKEGMKEGVKGKVKTEAGSKIGTSKKAGTGEQGIDYQEIRNKDMDELAEE